MSRPRLFLSAASEQLGSARRAAVAVVRNFGYDPVSQDDFPTGHGELRQWLREQIDSCEGVIQIVGNGYGAEPRNRTRNSVGSPTLKKGSGALGSYQATFRCTPRFINESKAGLTPFDKVLSCKLPFFFGIFAVILSKPLSLNWLSATRLTSSFWRNQELIRLICSGN